MGKVERTALSIAAMAAVAAVSNATRLVPLLHENPQSVFDGQHKHYVNLSAGNLSLWAHDLVVRVENWNATIGFNRIYDSRITSNPDFGPGWRLSLAEELLLGEGAATYVDESGARYRFRADGNRYVASPPTPGHAKSRISFAADGPTAVLNVDDPRGAFGGALALTKVFRRSTGDSSRYLLVSLQSRHEKRVSERWAGSPETRIVVHQTVRARYFHYADDLMQSIAAEGETHFRIHRDGDGRIVKVTDRDDRTVRYGYTPNGRLGEMVDPDGYVLRYEYGPGGRLKTAYYAEGGSCLDVRYEAKGRVAEVRGNQYCRNVSYQFAYGPTDTSVRFIGAEMPGTNPRTYPRNEAGVTLGWSYPTGVARRYALDSDNRIVDVVIGRRTDLFPSR